MLGDDELLRLHVLFDVLDDAHFPLFFQVFLLEEHDLLVVSISVLLVLDVLFEEILRCFGFIDHSFDVVDAVEELGSALELFVLLQLRHLLVVSSLRFLRDSEHLFSAFQIFFD